MEYETVSGIIGVIVWIMFIVVAIYVFLGLFGGYICKFFGYICDCDCYEYIWYGTKEKSSHLLTCSCGFEEVEVRKWTYDDVEALFIPLNREKPWRAYCHHCGTAGQPGRTPGEAKMQWNIVVTFIKEQEEREKMKQSKKGGQ